MAQAKRAKRSEKSKQDTAVHEGTEGPASNKKPRGKKATSPGRPDDEPASPDPVPAGADAPGKGTKPTKQTRSQTGKASKPQPSKPSKAAKGKASKSQPSEPSKAAGREASKPRASKASKSRASNASKSKVSSEVVEQSTSTDEVVAPAEPGRAARGEAASKLAGKKAGKKAGKARAGKAAPSGPEMKPKAEKGKRGKQQTKKIDSAGNQKESPKGTASEEDQASIAEVASAASDPMGDQPTEKAKSSKGSKKTATSSKKTATSSKKSATSSKKSATSSKKTAKSSKKTAKAGEGAKPPVSEEAPEPGDGSGSGTPLDAEAAHAPAEPQSELEIADPEQGPQLTLIDGEGTTPRGSDLLGDGDAQADEGDIEDTEGYLRGLIEAILFVSDKPLTVKEVARAAKLDKKRTQEIIDELRQEYRERGMVLHEAVGGISFRSNPRYGEYVRTHLAQRPVRLSRAQLETLAIIAYRQPITRPEIDDIRGVDCGPVLKGLLERDLVRILGKKDEPGRPMLYGTSDAFLELFSLDSLKDLPTLREFTELSDESKDKFQSELGEEAPAGPIEFDDAAPASLDDGEPLPVDADGVPTEAFRERAEQESFGDDDEGLDAGLLGAELEELERREAERMRRRADADDTDADDTDADDTDADDTDADDTDADGAADPDSRGADGTGEWDPQPPRARLSIEDDTDAGWDDADAGETRGSISIGMPSADADELEATSHDEEDEDDDDDDDDEDDED